MADDPETGVFVIHSIDDSGKTISYHVAQVPGFIEMETPTHFFANSSYVAEISSALKEKGLASEQDQTSYPLILLFKRDGSFQKFFSLPPDFEPKTVGVFPKTGDVLVVGVTRDSKEAHIKIYRDDGQELTSFALLDDDPNTGPNSKVKQSVTDILKSGALAFAQIVSSGDNLLMVPTLTNQPILELNEHGVVRSIDVKLPQGSIFGPVLDADSLPWYMKIFGDVHTSAPGDPHQGSSMSPGPVLAVNPYDGSIERIIATTPERTSVVCEADRTLLGLTTNKDSGALELSTGAIPP